MPNHATQDSSDAGLYDPQTHSVWMYDIAFKATILGHDSPGAGYIGSAAREVLHEIGHTISHRPQRTGGADLDSAGSAFRRAANADGKVRITGYADKSWAS